MQNEDFYNPDRWKLGIFYFNPEDKRFLVPKRFGIGWTFNFGKWYSYAAILVLIGAIYAVSLLLKN